MSQLLDITISFKGNMVQSILIEDWPTKMPLPRVVVLDNERAACAASMAPDEHAPVGATMKQNLPDVLRCLKLRGIEYVRVSYLGGFGDARVDLFIPPKSNGRQPYFIPAETANQLKNFFIALLESRHPECFDALGSSGVFRWMIDPEVLVHRHTAHASQRTFVYHGL